MSSLNNTTFYINTYVANTIYNIENTDQLSTALILPDYPIQPGFGFINDTSTRAMVLSAYKAVARAEAWSLLRNFTGDSFILSVDPQITDLMTRVDNEYSGGHSGASMGCTMRHMEYIAKNGFTNYRDYIMESSREVVPQPLNVRRSETRHVTTVHLPQ